LIIVKSSVKAVNITLTASADGLPSSKLVIITVNK
jgi:hypothetical protein